MWHSYIFWAHFGFVYKFISNTQMRWYQKKLTLISDIFLSVYTGHTRSSEHVNGGTFTKTDVFLVTGDALTFFSQIHFMYHTFLPVLHNLEYVTSVEVHFSMPEPCTYIFMDCHVILIVWVSCDISRSWNEVSKCRLGRIGGLLPVLFICPKFQTCCVRWCFVLKNGVSVEGCSSRNAHCSLWHV